MGYQREVIMLLFITEDELLLFIKLLHDHRLKKNICFRGIFCMQEWNLCTFSLHSRLPKKSIGNRNSAQLKEDWPVFLQTVVGMIYDSPIVVTLSDDFDHPPKTAPGGLKPALKRSLLIEA